LVVLWFELGASYLLGKTLYHLSHSPSQKGLLLVR
jgi:hypothetical protein